MEIMYGPNSGEYGPGVVIEMTGDDVATAISAWLVAKGVNVQGPRTIVVNGELCEEGRVFVDPIGRVEYLGSEFLGRGPGRHT